MGTCAVGLPRLEYSATRRERPVRADPAKLPATARITHLDRFARRQRVAYRRELGRQCPAQAVLPPPRQQPVLSVPAAPWLRQSGLGGGRVAGPGRTLCSRSRCTVSCVQTVGRSAAVLGRLHSASERCTQTAPPIARAHVSGWQMVGERWVCRADRGGRTPRPPARPGGGPAAALSSQQAHLAGGAAGIQPPLPPTPLERPTPTLPSPFHPAFKTLPPPHHDP